MIAAPKRAVTRFLIPFIDVLILLFGIFLLMPFVSRPDEPVKSESPGELEILRKRVTDLKKDRSQLFKNFHVVILEIDADSGGLYYQDNLVEGRRELTNQADSMRFIARERARAGEKQASFIIRYPRVLSGFPLLKQIENYRLWFAEVPLEIDVLPEVKS